MKIFHNIIIFALSNHAKESERRKHFVDFQSSEKICWIRVLFTSHIFSQTRSVNETCCMFNASWDVRESK